MDPPDPLSPSEVIDESETNLMRLRSGKRISEPPNDVQQEWTAASSSSNSAASPPVAPAPTPTPTATSSTSATPAVYSAPAATSSTSATPAVSSAPADPLPPPVLMSRSQFLAALSFVVFVVVIGVPVWWATTGTYRAVLPHTDIASFSSSLRLDTSIPVTIWISSSRNRRTVESTVAQIKMLNSEFVSYDVNVASVPPAILKSFEASSNLSEEHKVLELLGEEEGVVNIVEVPARLLSSQIHVGSHRTIFVASDNVAEAFPDADLALVLAHVVGDAALKQEVARWKNAELEVDSNQLRRVPSHGTYNLIFSLLNPSPDLIRADWKPHLAFQGYLQPFMEKLSGLANFHVSSQSLYFLPLPVKGKWNDGLGCRVIPASHLPHVITPFEAKLGSVTSTSPSLHFLLYVHPDVSGPLCISKTSAPNPPTSAGHLLPSNSFLSPRWGGVQIWNNDQKPVNGSSAPQDVRIDPQRWMAPFLSQLRLLLGLQDEISLPGVTWSPPVLGSVRDWEIDFLWRLRTVENMIETVQALKALSDLLATISNIVIRDDIAALVFSATEQLKNASALHVSALNPRAAFQASAEAYRKSNKAFFDESLLELLYFPDDQKFAVYLPLFIPVGAPIVLSFQDMYRSWRHGLTST